MSLNIRLTPAARRHLQEIRAYIAREGSPAAAEAMVARLADSISGLAQTPFKGRPAPGASRELTTVRPYIVRYRVLQDMVTVIRIRHAARRPTE